MPSKRKATFNNKKQNLPIHQQKNKKPSAKADQKIYKEAWQTYRSLQSQINQAWDQLQKDIKKGAHPEVLWQDRNQLLLLLGECNYMAKEYIRQMRQN